MIIIACLITAGVFLYLAFNQPKPVYTVFNTNRHEMLFEGDYRQDTDITDYINLWLYLERLQHNMGHLVRGINNNSIPQTQMDLSLLAISNELNSKVLSLNRFTEFPVFNELSQAFLSVQNYLRQARQGETLRNLNLAIMTIKEFL